MSLLNCEALLRIGAFGCFLGHGWIAAWKLEVSGWKKIMVSAGFTEAEAHVLMPIIGWMDVCLATVTLIRPVECFSAWMAAWAFSTALVRPVSAGLDRALSPMSDNALWGFVERAANWVCPLALLCLQKADGYVAADITGLSSYLAPLDVLNVDADLDTLFKYICLMVCAVWAPVPLLRSRGKGKRA